jgi:hypothetical protein
MNHTFVNTAGTAFIGNAIHGLRPACPQGKSYRHKPVRSVC